MDIRQRIAVGPVVSPINASPSSFKLYKSGIFNLGNSECSGTLNHSMTVVGYG